MTPSGLFDLDRLLDTLGRSTDMSVVKFSEYSPGPRQVILRHDVDLLPAAALRCAVAASARDIHGSYFIRSRASGYNLAAPDVIDVVAAIATLGHEVGLHLDLIPGINRSGIDHCVDAEHRFFADVLPMSVSASNVVSAHRPPRWILGAPFAPPFANAYAPPFFGASDSEYHSDSDGRFDWDAFERKLAADSWRTFQLLIHPEWWTVPAADVGGVFAALVAEEVAAHRTWLAREIDAFARIEGGSR